MRHFIKSGGPLGDFGKTLDSQGGLSIMMPVAPTVASPTETQKIQKLKTLNSTLTF
jgi:hypothetical protein